MRRATVAAVLVALVLSLTPILPARADWVWNLFLEAQRLEQNGQIDQAMPLWRQLAETYGQNGDPANAAIFWKKLGKAQDDRGMRNEAILAYEQEAVFWALAGHADWGKPDLARADQLRTSVRLFAEQAAPKPSRPLAKHEPANGALFGAYTELDPAVRYDWADAERVYGKPLAAALIYWSYGRLDLDITIEHAKRAGVGLQLALQPLKGMQEVKDDAYLHDLARTLKESGLPIFLRFAGEMNGEWVPWHTDPQTYIEKYRLVSRVMKAEAPNVAMVWAPGYVPENYADYYPGDEWVDWVGISMYLDFYASGKLELPTERDNPLDMVKGIVKRYGDRKPVMIAEWGVATRDYTTGAQHHEWAKANLLRYYAGLPRLFPSVKAVFYFMVDQQDAKTPWSSVWSDYRLSDKPEVLAAFQKAVGDPYYLSQVGTAAPNAYREIPATGERVDAGTARLSAAVKLYDPMVSKVEYLVDGRAVGSATTAPYALDVDFTPYDGRRVNVTVRAYSSLGRVDGEAAFPVAVGLTDVADHWATEQIRALVGRKIVTGYPDGTFRPEEPISREAFFKLLASSVGATGQAPVRIADLPTTSWSYEYASALVAAGILRLDEYPGGRIQPEAPITREEMAVLVARAGGLVPGAAPSFADVAEIRSSWQATVGAAVSAGLLTGFEDNTYRPRDGASRAQAAVVILRLLNRMQ